jgi:hypothetical protein
MKFSFPQFLNATTIAFKAFIHRVGENDSAANRAQNRRVDITFANGRDRPGVWTGSAPAAAAR